MCHTPATAVAVVVVAAVVVVVAVAVAVAVAVVSPSSLVQDGKSRNEYRGVFHAIQTIVRQEGPTGLYRGLTPNLMGSGVSWSVQHACVWLIHDMRGNHTCVTCSHGGVCHIKSRHGYRDMALMVAVMCTDMLS